MSTREFAIVLFGLLVVVLQFLGSRFFPEAWWGLHLWSFLPGAAFWLAVAGLTAAFLVVFLRGGPGRDAPRNRTWLPGRPRAWLLIAPAYMALALLLRVRHLLLGDGIPLVRHLPLGTAFHPRQPLTYRVQHDLHTFFSGFLGASEKTAETAVAFGSVLAGGIFALVAWGLAGEILRASHGGSPAADEGATLETEPPRSIPRLLLASILLCQGYALLFFGYVENYTWLLLLTGVFLWTGLRAARGADRPFVSGLVAVLAAAFHLSGALLLPAWFLLVVALSRGKRLHRFLALDFAVVAAGALALQLILSRMEPGYDWVGTILTVGRVTTVTGQGGINARYLWTFQHLRDYLNEQWLLGPVALFFIILVVATGAAFRVSRGRGLLFLGANALTWFAAYSRIAASNLGYPRDWDLQAPAGLSFAVLGLFLFAPPGASASEMRRPRLTESSILVLVLLVSLFHFVPWVAVNASENLSSRRVALLPIDGGRREILLGTWNYRQGRLEEARDWYLKSVEVYPQNHLAYSGLGVVALDIRDYEKAERFFRLAVSIKPDQATYREGLLTSLLGSGRLEDAAREYPGLLELTPDNVTNWLQYARLLDHLGHGAEAREAFRKVLEIDPQQAEALERVR